MSRKTENIYKAIEKLEILKNQLELYNETAGGAGDSADADAVAVDNKALQDIEFQMGQELKSLRFWIDSLYRYNGKSTSNAKKNSSRENGKKGGRPPKVVTDLKKRRAELEDNIIPDLESKKKATNDFLEERCFSEEIEKYQKEIEEIDDKLIALRNKN